MKKILLLSCIAAITLLSGAASADSCQQRAVDGSCLDTAAPTTGQFTNAADQAGASHVTGLRASQAHANVKLTQATYVLAHNICRYVDNPGSHGMGLFIGLEVKSEWTSFINSPPAGASLQYCCQPATVSICGKATAVPFGVSGKSYAYAGGYNFKATYTCGANLTGIAPTQDTSWKVVTSGACADPTPACPDGSDHGGKDGGNACGDSTDDSDHQNKGGPGNTAGRGDSDGAD